ncbi:MAG: DUF167 domain-containing protein [Chlorobiaceae bacterium]|nr:DUF167 domain-containing protein [Chlorobiaceae bacterium]
MIELREKNGNAVFMVRVQPRSSKSMICGEYNGGLKVALKSAPVDDAANEECCRLLSGIFKVPVTRVHIVSGRTSRTKTVLVEGVRSGDAAGVLEPYC